MTTPHTKALALLNTLIKLVFELQAYTDYSDRSGTVYVPVGNSCFELELEYYKYDLESRLKAGEELSPSDIVGIYLKSNPDHSHFPEKYTEADVAELVKEVSNNYWYKYHSTQGHAERIRKELTALNEEAGVTIIDVNVIDSLLKSSEEFYESSRCW